MAHCFLVDRLGVRVSRESQDVLLVRVRSKVIFSLFYGLVFAVPMLLTAAFATAIVPFALRDLVEYDNATNVWFSFFAMALMAVFILFLVLAIWFIAIATALGALEMMFGKTICFDQVACVCTVRCIPFIKKRIALSTIEAVVIGWTFTRHNVALGWLCLKISDTSKYMIISTFLAKQAKCAEATEQLILEIEPVAKVISSELGVPLRIAGSLSLTSTGWWR